MRKQILPLMVSAVVLMAGPAFAMDGESQPNNQDILISELIDLEKSRKGEIMRNKIFTSIDNQDGLSASKKKLCQIDEEIKKIKNTLGEKVIAATLEPTERLIPQAKEGNIQAQDELMRRCKQGLKPDTIDFSNWKDIKERCYTNDTYAFFAIVNKIEIPDLFDKIKERAEQGILAAQYSLARMYQEGLGVGGKSDENDTLSIEWFTKAANQGHLGAKHHLGWMFKEGRGVGGKSDENDKLAIKWYTEAAEQGHSGSQNNLGCMYDEGRGVGGKSDENAKIADHCFAEAAKQGSPTAQYNWARMNEEGRGKAVKTSKTMAIYLYSKAAEQGHPDAQYNLGRMYEECSLFGRKSNDILPINWSDADKLAIKWYTEADKLAIKWYTEAAKQGHSGAQYNLGRMYEEGRGVEKNPVEALHWYRKSKTPAAKDKIYSLLGRSDNSCKEKGDASFKDLRDEILLEDRLANLQGSTQKDQEDAVMGLASLVYTPQIKREASNPDSINRELAIPQRYELYKTVKAVEGEVLENF